MLIKIIFHHTFKRRNKRNLENDDCAFYKNHKLISSINSGHKRGKCSGLLRQYYMLNAKRGEAALWFLPQLSLQNHRTNCY